MQDGVVVERLLRASRDSLINLLSELTISSLLPTVFYRWKSAWASHGVMVQRSFVEQDSESDESLAFVSLRSAILDGLNELYAWASVNRRFVVSNTNRDVDRKRICGLCMRRRPHLRSPRWSNVSGLGFFGTEYDESKYLSITYR